MTVVGFNFTRVIAEKNAPIRGRININNNVSITKIEETTLPLDKSKTALQFTFLYTSKFEPNVGKVELEGTLLYLQTKEVAKKVLDQWKKDKKILPEVMTPIMNQILNKCNIQALILTRDLNLPSPIPMPKVGTQPVKPGPAKK
ncbi:MAG: hypothetical protein ABIE94_02655 [archaeon]